MTSLKAAARRLLYLAGTITFLAGSWLLALRPARAAEEEGAPHGDISIDCGDCHREEQWVPVTKPPVFRHDKTGFPLVGAHTGVGCRKCHTTLVFNRVGTSCADCHKEPHRGEMGFRCERCHTPQSWTNTQAMAHSHQLTRFPLVGAHASLDCRACHRAQRAFEYKNTPTQCYACHSADFAAATSPNHAAAGFSHDCQNCHAITSRTFGTGFEHPARFPLTGIHATLPCSRCHPTGLTAVAGACYACHANDYRRVTNPNHVTSSFPTTCQDCHTTSGWEPARFNHASTGFALSGAHASLGCDRCHPNGRFAGTSSDCVSCHRNDYNSTNNPSHVASSFPTTCQSCHTTNAWRPATFNHASTPFPLTGAHTALTCARCHPNGRFAGTSPDCVSCHRSNYNSATSPNHVASNFPTTCQNCHTTNAWQPATFNHSSTGFALTGVHTTLTCDRCHPNGRFAGTPTDCYACHQANYNGATNPNHAAAGFPTNCQLCHTTGGWRPSTFNHDAAFFPINSGRHAGAWTRCSDCHVNAANFAVFECVLCHQHNNKAQVDSNHRGVSGYSYSSPRCYACHPRGVAD